MDELIISCDVVNFSIMDKMRYFSKLRDLTLYSVLHKKLDINNLDENYNKLLKDIRERIIERATIV